MRERENRACLEHVSFRSTSNWLLWSCRLFHLNLFATIDRFRFSFRPKIDWGGKFFCLLTYVKISAPLQILPVSSGASIKAIEENRKQIESKMRHEKFKYFSVPTLRHFTVNLQHIKLWKKIIVQSLPSTLKHPPRVKKVGGVSFYVPRNLWKCKTLAVAFGMRKWALKFEWGFIESNENDGEKNSWSKTGW